MNTRANAIELAATAIRTADALLIGAGAGMGVDSGLPDFRGDEGFWKAYPPFRGRAFAQMSNPRWFAVDPAQAWGFFGHRLHLYRDTMPHEGFAILRRWCEKMGRGYFVFTSNVDGQFQKAGFPAERVLECHGSVHFLQCAQPCCTAIWPSDDVQVTIDMNSIRATTPCPVCPHCQGVARPNLLMFGDWNWATERYVEQHHRYRSWLNKMRDARLVAIEMGAGLAIPTVRHECEQRAHMLIRINPREPGGPDGCISIAMGARDALTQIDERLL